MGCVLFIYKFTPKTTKKFFLTQRFLKWTCIFNTLSNEMGHYSKSNQVTDMYGGKLYENVFNGNNKEVN